jgi:hypothetical protein
MENTVLIINILTLLSFLLIPLPTGTITFVIGLSYLGSFFSLVFEIIDGIILNLGIYNLIRIDKKNKI